MLVPNSVHKDDFQDYIDKVYLMGGVHNCCYDCEFSWYCNKCVFTWTSSKQISNNEHWERWVTGKTSDKLMKIFDIVNSLLTDPFEKENLIKTLKFIQTHEELNQKNKWITMSKNYCLSLCPRFINFY